MDPLCKPIITLKKRTLPCMVLGGLSFTSHWLSSLEGVSGPDVFHCNMAWAHIHSPAVCHSTEEGHQDILGAVSSEAFDGEQKLYKFSE